MEPWRPGRRRAQRQLETPFEGVPDHLFAPLWSWLRMFLNQDAELVHLIGLEFRLVMRDARLSDAAHREALGELAKLTTEDRNFLLDLIEYVLEVRCAKSLYSPIWQGQAELDPVLLIGNSVYKVNEQHAGLELRTTPEVQAQVQAVVDGASGSAGEHLATSWNEAYARSSDPAKAYSEAIKAVEAAMARRVSPQNEKQTLGTMIRDLAAKPEKWVLDIPAGRTAGPETVLAMMRLLWDGQTSRHGGSGRTQPETLEQAQAAVHLAATLVQWSVSGAFRAT